MRRVLTVVLAVAALILSTTSVATADQRIGARYQGVVDSASTDDASFPRTALGSISLMGGSYWPSLEVRPGTWDFAALDAKVATARRHGARPLVVLGFSPTFHSTRPGSATPYAAPPKMWAWKRYVRKLALRYGKRVDYQVWPEPNIIQNWTGTPRQMARLQRAAHQIIHRVRPRATVAGPATVLRLPKQQEWVQQFYRTRLDGVNVGRYVDVVALDPYPLQYGTPEQSMQLARRARAIFRNATGLRRPVWTVEINYGVAGGGQTISGPFRMSKQISYVIRTYALSPAYGVKRVYWLGWGNYSTMGVSLTRPDGVTPTASGKAFARVRRWMLHYTHRGCDRARSGVWTCTLTGRTGGDPETRKILWRTQGTSIVRAPRRSFQLQRGGGRTTRIRGGYRIKVGTMPTLVRIHR